MRSVLLVLVTTLLGACARHPRPALLPVRGPARDSLVQLDLARTDSAAALGALNGMLSLLADDLVFLCAGAPIVYGREAARRLLEANPPPAGTVLSWQPLGGELSGDHRSGYTYGVAARVSRQGEPNLDLARYIAFWKRDGSVGAMGGWRI